MTNEVRIKTVADTKQAEQAFDQLGKKMNLTASLKKVSSGFADINGAVRVAQDVLREVGEVYDETVGKTLAYAKSVREMALVSGTGAEATSRLVQVMDDFGVTSQTLETILRGAAQKGIQVTADSLANMADEYNALVAGKV